MKFEVLPIHEYIHVAHHCMCVCVCVCVCVGGGGGGANRYCWRCFSLLQLHSTCMHTLFFFLDMFGASSGI